MNSFANIPFSFGQWRETLFMEQVKVVVSIPYCNYIFSCFQLLGFHFFISPLLSTIKTKITKKKTHQISPSFITRRKVSFNTSIFSNRREIQESYILISSQSGVNIKICARSMPSYKRKFYEGVYVSTRLQRKMVVRGKGT